MHQIRIMKYQKSGYIPLFLFALGSLVLFSNFVLLSCSATNHLPRLADARESLAPTTAQSAQETGNNRRGPSRLNRRHGAGYLTAKAGRKTSETDRLDPPWRSKQEIVFLQHLKNLTNTTTQTRRTCNGAKQLSFGSDDVTGRSQSPPSERSLLPVMLGNQGPNNQLQAFRLVAAVAMQRNYTLVRAPFFNHASVDGLDMRCFEDTLDPGAVSHLVPFMTMDKFREKCSERVDAVLLGTRMTESAQSEQNPHGLELYMDGQTQTFAEMTGIQIPSIVYHRQNSEIIVDLPQNTPPHAISLKNYLHWYPAAFQSHSKCVAFVYPYGLLGRFPHNDFVPLLTRHLIRPKEIRDLAGTFLNKTGVVKKGFVCVHWRFNKEWKHLWCSSHGQWICDTLNAMSVGRLAERFVRQLDRCPLGALYFASPVAQQEKEAIVAALKRAVDTVYWSDDITNALWGVARDSPAPAGPLIDGYRLSLLEQEICSKSNLFIASEYSSWSDNVLIERRVRGSPSMYAIEVLTGDEVANNTERLAKLI